MRIISGKFKGRRFTPPAKNWPTRPTTDFSKEGLFNILQNRLDFETLKVLDLFGGTGNHSYEFISRGVQDVTYVDKFRGCISFVRKMAKELEIEHQIQIIQQDVFTFIKNTSATYDYIFAGPPYGLINLDEIPNYIFNYQLLKPQGLFVLEHNPNHDFQHHQHFEQMKKYGGTLLVFSEIWKI